MFNKKMSIVTLVSIITVAVISLLILFCSLELHTGEVTNSLFTTEETTTATVTTDVTTAKETTTTTVTTDVTTTKETTTTVISTVTEEILDEYYYDENQNDTIEFTVTTNDNNTYYFYRESMRVHRPDCVYTDSSCMELIEGDYIDEARPCQVCNPNITIGTLYEEDTNDIYEEQNNKLQRNWSVSEMTYYSGPYGCYGASGRTLINNYSVACNSIPLGTIVYIKSSDGSVDGYYRVDDTGGMGNNVIDIFYSDYSYTPSSFRQLGRVPCQVWIVE